MATSATLATVRQKYEALAPLLHEKAQRRWAACEARALGRGGIALVAAATGLSRPTIRRGLAEIDADPSDAAEEARGRAHPSHRWWTPALDRRGSLLAGGPQAPRRSRPARRSDVTPARDLQEYTPPRPSPRRDGA